MEEEKKKKRNKKKKNKQTKVTDDVAIGIGESASMDHDHVSVQNHHAQASETTDVRNDVSEKTDVDLDKHLANGTENTNLAEAEKLDWLNREASLEVTIKQLQKENDAHLEKEAALEMKIAQLQREKDAWLQKEGGFEAKINQLIDEAATLTLKGVSLEERTKHLERERDSLIQKEASLEERTEQLETERDSWIQKEASLEERTKQLETERDSWIQKENTTEEVIARLNYDNTSLRTQVMELEESRNNLLQENQRLIENGSGMQSQIQDLERSTASARSSSVTTMHASENEDLNTQNEAARALVEKLVTENAELVEKVNELYVELDRHGVAAHNSSVVGSDLTVGSDETALVADPSFEFGERTFESGKRMESSEDVVIEDERNGGDHHHVNAEDAAKIAESSLDFSGRTSMLVEPLEGVAINDDQDAVPIHTGDTFIIPDLVETINSEEIVQIPLDENEVKHQELWTPKNEKKSDVALSDAPLIGAPFRLFSFVARYVSGADLVNKNSDN